MKIGMRYAGCEETVHIAAEAGHDYATVCGLSADGDSYSGVPFKVRNGDLVDCEQCKMIWNACKTIKVSDFK